MKNAQIHPLKNAKSQFPFPRPLQGAQARELQEHPVRIAARSPVVLRIADEGALPWGN